MSCSIFICILEVEKFISDLFNLYQKNENFIKPINLLIYQEKTRDDSGENIKMRWSVVWTESPSGLCCLGLFLILSQAH